jgi:hypothetical protein
VRGEVVSVFRTGPSPYAAGQHRGIDIEAAAGTPVVAASAGTVRFAGVAGSSGLTVSLRTADGRFDTSYLHLSAMAVRAGDTVTQGGTIGAVGSTGRPSAPTPHLHLGVRDAGTRHGYRDPLAFLPPPGGVGDLPRLAPAPRHVPVTVPPAFERRRVARREPATARLGWAVACAGLILAAALTGGRRLGAGGASRSSIGARAVLRHNADLLRQR